ncbi:MAG: Holliday junction resolvase RuvX [Alphaproteobacteria bacterium]|nr:Holliday junction resolvase RuvX [Alphaproteobacteria bacterium]
MAELGLQELKAALPRNGRLLGLDLGTKTIGLAISDGALLVASPLETIRRTKFTADAQALLAVIDRHGVTGLVLGLPVNMDGTEGPRCQSTRQFARNLMGLREVPFAFWDERLSTAAVQRAMIDADLSRARRAKVVDQMAAAYILQGALDFLRRN